MIKNSKSRFQSYLRFKQRKNRVNLLETQSHMFPIFDDPIASFKAKLKPKDLEGLMGEAQAHFMLVSEHLHEMDYAPDRIRELAQYISETDLPTAPLMDVIDQFIEWTEEKVYSQGYDDEDRVRVALYLALYCKSYLEVADDTFMSFEILFKKCYFEYYKRLDCDPDGPIQYPDYMEYMQTMRDMSEELMPSDKREHIQHLRDEEPSLIDRIKQMKVVCDDVPAPDLSSRPYEEDPLSRYLKSNLPPEMAEDKEVIRTIESADTSGLLGLVRELSNQLESTYTKSLPATERAKVQKRIDELVYSSARYNVPVFFKDYLRIVFWLYNVSPEFHYLIDVDEDKDHWDGFLNEMLWYIDSKRPNGPLGDSWVREARDMIIEHQSLEAAQKAMPSIEYYYNLRDNCGKLKEVEYTEEFLRSVVDAYIANASVYDIEKSYDERCILLRELKARVQATGERFKQKGEYFSPVLVYDGRTHTIKEDKTYLATRGVTVIRGIGSVSDYFSCLMEEFSFDMLTTGTRFHDIRSDVGISDEDEYEMPMAPEVMLELERSICRHCGLTTDDERFDRIRLEFARRWIEYKVNLDLCEKVPRRPEDKKPLHCLSD